MNADYLMNAAILLLPKEDRDKIADAHIGPKSSKILSHNRYIFSAKKQNNQLLDYHKNCQEYRHGIELVPKKKQGSESVGEDYISTVGECDSRIRVHCSRETDSNKPDKHTATIMCAKCYGHCFAVNVRTYKSISTAKLPEELNTLINDTSSAESLQDVVWGDINSFYSNTNWIKGSSLVGA